MGTNDLPLAPSKAHLVGPLPTIHKRDLTIPKWQGFLFATVAPQFAVLFTNPFDTAKVRLQLQGQDGSKTKVYKNSLDCMAKILRNEGIRGLQQGLTPAIFREGSKNIFRLGLFEPIVSILHDKDRDKRPPPMWKRLIAGAASGALGALACNPFELIKTRMQARTYSLSSAVGHQHHYSGMLHAFADIYKKEGLQGLYRGSGMSIVRGVLGTSTNLATYSWLRDYALMNGLLSDCPTTDVMCSMTSAFITTLFMNPVDVLRTRLYNQPVNPDTGKGLMYANGLDALSKIVRNEGVRALYKGFLTGFMRLGPHFTLTFLFLEQMRRMARTRVQNKLEMGQQQELRQIFDEYDLNNDGRLDACELYEMVLTAIPRKTQPNLSDEEYRNSISREIQNLLPGGEGGSLSFSQFPDFTANLERAVVEYQLKSAFVRFDLQKKQQHTTTVEELVAALREVVPNATIDKHHGTILNSATEAIEHANR